MPIDIDEILLFLIAYSSNFKKEKKSKMVDFEGVCVYAFVYRRGKK